MNEIAKMKREVKLKQWAEMVQLRNESGLAVSEWCEQHGVNVKTYYYRLKQIRQALCDEVEQHDIVAIRPFTVGRKNWLFSDTPRGAKASAAIYSIVETAKANGLDVFKYFELLLTVLPSMEFLTNPDILEELLPWNEAAQKICKLP